MWVPEIKNLLYRYDIKKSPKTGIPITSKKVRPVLFMEQIIKVPDIGSSAAVDVIEILVKVGDKVEVETPIGKTVYKILDIKK